MHVAEPNDANAGGKDALQHCRGFLPYILNGNFTNILVIVVNYALKHGRNTFHYQTDQVRMEKK